MLYQPPRKQIFLYLDVLDQKDTQLVGHLNDISSQGLMLLCDQPLDLHSIRHFKIKLPDNPDFSRAYLDVDVEIRWTSQDINPDLYKVGCLFLELDAESNAIIKQIGESLSF